MIMYKCTFCGMLYKYIPLKGEAWQIRIKCRRCEKSTSYKIVNIKGINK